MAHDNQPLRIPLDNFECQVLRCVFRATCAIELMSHYLRIHRDDPCFQSNCLYSKNCSHASKFYTASSLYKHLTTCHPFFEEANYNKQLQNKSTAALHKNDGNLAAQSSSLQAEIPDPTSPGSSTQDCLSFSLTDELSGNTSNCGMSTKSKAASFVLRLMEERKFTQVDVQHIIQETRDLLNSALGDILGQVSGALKEQGCNHDDVITTCTERVTSNLFVGVESQHSRSRYFKEELGMIAPKKIFLPLLPSQFGRDNTREKQPTRGNYSYVPILEICEKFLNKKDIYDAVMTTKAKGIEFICRFEDGLVYEQNPFFKDHPHCLQLHLYLDEVEVCNPLGSKTKAHKLVFVYLGFGNLDVRFRSALKNILLVTIFYNHQVKAHGINKLFDPIVDDLKKLENGVDLCIGGRVEKIFGALVAISADNLASHTVGGFKTGFAKSFRPCRTCLSTREEMQTKYTGWEFTLRDKESHDLQCAGLETASEKHFSQLYGLNFNSVFNRLQHFHVVGGLVPDILHDILEGCLPLTICELLLHCIKKKKYFHLDDLNYTIDTFSYGGTERKDKPSLLEISHLEKRKLRQSAAQTWLLAVLLPLFVGKHVPKNDHAWICFTTLLEICQLVFKDDISQEELPILDSLVDEYLSEFRKTFKRNIIPKQHFLVHLSHYIRQVGPLNAFWCMRYEAKHSYFKQLTRAVGQFKNLPWTLSNRHQQWQCNNLLRAGPYLKPDLRKPARNALLSVSTMDSRGQLADMFSFQDFNQAVNSLSWLEIGSLRYKSGDSIVLCPLAGARRVAFGLIVGIYEYQNRIAFWCQILETVKYDQHLQAFKVRCRKDNFHLLISPDNLLDYRIRHLHCSDHVVNMSYPGRTMSLHYIISKTKINLH